jgi:hypothetical protein
MVVHQMKTDIIQLWFIEDFTADATTLLVLISDFFAPGAGVAMVLLCFRVSFRTGLEKQGSAKTSNAGNLRI